MAVSCTLPSARARCPVHELHAACSEASRSPVLHQRSAAHLPLWISVAVPNLCFRFHGNVCSTGGLVPSVHTAHVQSIQGARSWVGFPQPGPKNVIPQKCFEIKVLCQHPGNSSKEQ